MIGERRERGARGERKRQRGEKEENGKIYKGKRG